MFNAAKYDVDESSLIQEIQQLGLPKDSSDLIGRFYREQKEFLTAILRRDSYRISRLISTTWLITESKLNQEVTHLPTEQMAQFSFQIDINPDGEKKPVTKSTVQELTLNINSDKLDILIYELSTALTRLIEL
jgi:hypothetical protein